MTLFSLAVNCNVEKIITIPFSAAQAAILFFALLKHLQCDLENIECIMGLIYTASEVFC